MLAATFVVQDSTGKLHAVGPAITMICNGLGKTKLSGGDLQSLQALTVALRLADGTTTFAALVNEGIPHAVALSSSRDLGTTRVGSRRRGGFPKTRRPPPGGSERKRSSHC